MVPCSVTSHYCSYIVEFQDGRSILLQTDYDQASFAVHSGYIVAPKDWDGCPSKLGKAWIDFDMTDICQCPEDYLDIAEVESRE